MNNAIKKYKALPTQMRATVWFLFCSFMQKGITFITTPIFTRLLTTEEYGRFNVFNSWYGIISVFATLSLCYGVFSQGIIKFEEDRDRFVSSLQGLTVVLIAFWTGVYFLFRPYWNQLFRLTTVQMLALLAMCWTNAAFTFWAVEQRALFKYRGLVFLTILTSVIKPLLGIILVVKATDKVTARILGLAIVELIASFYCFGTHMAKGKVFADLKYWKYAVLFNLPLIPHYLSQTVLNNSDRIMIERMVGADKAGIYGIAYSISMIMVLFNTALGQTISPWMYKKIKDRRTQEIGPIAYGSMAFIAVVNLLLIALAPEIVRIFAPPEYYEAIWTIPPVAMSSYLLYMYDFFSRFEFYYEKTFGIMMASIAGAVLNLILNYIFIGLCGYIAAAYTTLVCYLIYVLCHYFMMRKICKDNDIRPRVFNEGFLILLTLGFMAAGFAMMATYRLPWLRYALIGAAMVAILVNYRKLLELGKRFMSLRKTANG